MVSQKTPSRTVEETFVVWSLGLTYVFYATGALYIVAPAIGWLLLLLVLWRFVTDDVRFRAPGLGVWIWWVSSAALLVALLVAHFDNNLGLGQTIKSTIGWAKGWAIFAVFITVGACLNIRLKAIARGANIVGLQTVILAPLLVGAAYAGIPPEVWVSPLKAVGGPGPEFFSFRLYSVSYDGSFRWGFFAPWAPGAGIAAIVLYSIGIWDRDWRWRSVGMLGAVLIAVMVKSRLAMLGLPMVIVGSWMLCRVSRPWVLMSGALACLVAGIGWTVLFEAAVEAKEAFEGYRPASTRVRATLQDIATYRAGDAPVFGHGVQGKGTHLVEFMPIGSHHTWNGLLFVKGLVGVIAFAAAMIWTSVELMVRGQWSRCAGAGLSCMLAMWLYSFGENVEVLVYLFWVGLLAVGRGLAVPRDPVAFRARSS